MTTFRSKGKYEVYGPAGRVRADSFSTLAAAKEYADEHGRGGARTAWTKSNTSNGVVYYGGPGNAYEIRLLDSAPQRRAEPSYALSPQERSRNVEVGEVYWWGDYRYVVTDAEYTNEIALESADPRLVVKFGPFGVGRIWLGSLWSIRAALARGALVTDERRVGVGRGLAFWNPR